MGEDAVTVLHRGFSQCENVMSDDDFWKRVNAISLRMRCVYSREILPSCILIKTGNRERQSPDVIRVISGIVPL